MDITYSTICLKLKISQKLDVGKKKGFWQVIWNQSALITRCNIDSL